jgi:hypothetical protein
MTIRDVLALGRRAERPNPYAWCEGAAGRVVAWGWSCMAVTLVAALALGLHAAG